MTYSRLIFFILIFKASSSLAVEPCGNDFLGVKLPSDATHCRVYDAKKSTVLTYFTPNTMQQIANFYQELADFTQNKKTSYSLALVPADKTFRIVLNEDPNGTQVSILQTKH
ncbi:MAG: hypothetical protein ACFHVJ_07650 [Aestuariibacter sp.]